MIKNVKSRWTNLCNGCYKKVCPNLFNLFMACFYAFTLYKITLNILSKILINDDFTRACWSLTIKNVLNSKLIFFIHFLILTLNLNYLEWFDWLKIEVAHAGKSWNRLNNLFKLFHSSHSDFIAQKQAITTVYEFSTYFSFIILYHYSHFLTFNKFVTCSIGHVQHKQN